MEKVFLHNTRISSSAVNEGKAFNRRRDSGHPRGRAISMFEMIQLILGYPQVHTDSEFVPVSTLPLGERRGVERTKPIDSLKRETLERVTVQNLPFATGPSDLMSNVIPVDRIRRFMILPPRRLHTDIEVMILKDSLFSPVSVDRVTIFGARPPELRSVFDQMGPYFRWFSRSRLSQTDTEISLSLNKDIERSHWIDGFGREVCL
jgi:hypothetical protein